MKIHSYTAKRYKKEFDNAPIVSLLTQHKLKLARFKYILKKKGNVSGEYKTAKGLKIALANTGRKHSQETKEKIRQSRLGSTLSAQHKLAISAGLMGHEVTEATKEKLKNVVITDERRRNISRAQSAEKSNSWKGGVSRHLYFGKGKFRLKRIFGEPLHCFFPECNKVEGENVKSVDCHHLDGDHENNPLDGSNWLPLCRRHHMIADGRLKGITEEEIEKARKLAFKVHAAHMKNNYIGEIKSYHD